MSTSAYLNFCSNRERIDLFMNFSEALDLNADEIEKFKASLYWEKKGDEMARIQQQINQEHPELSNNQAALIKLM